MVCCGCGPARHCGGAGSLEQWVHRRHTGPAPSAAQRRRRSARVPETRRGLRRTRDARRTPSAPLQVQRVDDRDTRLPQPSAFAHHRRRRRRLTETPAPLHRAPPPRAFTATYRLPCARRRRCCRTSQLQRTPSLLGSTKLH